MAIKQLIKEVAYPLIKARPDFLILGAQKAGTTSLYQYLVQHPQIYQRKSFKEVRYFDRNEHYRRGLSWYLGNFPYQFQSQGQLNCDASPNYLYYEDVPRLIKQDLGNIKMIAILREPVSRAYSAWQMFHSFETIDNAHLQRFYDKRNFTEAIYEELNPDFNFQKYPFRYDYIGRGKYAQQLENYYQYFKPSNILILNTQELYLSLANTLNEVCIFLEIDPFSEADLEKLNQKKYNEGKYLLDNENEDKKTLEMLKNHFKPFNEQLYNLLEYQYNW